MKHSSLRRSLLLAGITLPLVNFALPAWANALPASVDKQLAELERNANGRLGVAMINTGNGTKILYRAAQRFPFCSTFKFMLAAAVLDQSQSQPNLLNKHINYHESDLLSYAPITRKNLAHGMTVSELCAATIQYSDNTAANLLIKELGGLAAVNQFARSIGDQMFRLDRWEPDLNTARPNDPRDTTTPAAMAASMNKLVLGDALRPAQRSQLAVWLKGNTTGDATIRAGAPTDWIVGDKTGSGDYGTTNDIAVLWPTKGAPIVLVVYFTQREKDAKPRRDVLASVTKIILSQIS
ncbi:TPA: class A beta-lactamase BlaA [Yersinia enterocolitica]|uniref:Beta-lactamase n=1 Tax=Yersinia enterocolitica TaxID=630 RepID=A0ABM9S476_YEREN|nr:class A beta-lactamase BlaA [Yersinia enterocolitica]AOF14995.1 class A beta-lactamase [Yersinia enterocolitica]AOF19175.1 class A beta-lactamase [Yersinia enterocolitica]AOF23711.1 class A beta-lactamase [Yersinia enterocolitica]AOF27352.1 class A beta-lactamase [Yersinia enterocolitica]AOF31528.1 class A beta-lactamase [Yersinia enterocolitica]